MNKKVLAYVNSLIDYENNGHFMDEVEIVQDNKRGDIVALYKGKLYKAYFNEAGQHYFVDVLYGRVAS